MHDGSVWLEDNSDWERDDEGVCERDGEVEGDGGVVGGREGGLN